MTKSFKTLNCIALAAIISWGCTANKEASTEETYYAESDYPAVQKSDVHVHIFSERPDFMEVAAQENFKVISVALDAQNDMAGVRRQFSFCRRQKELNPESVEIVTAFSMEGWDEPGWLERNLAWLDSCFNNGAIAVKVWKNVGMSFRDKDGKLIMIDDARFDPIFSMLAARGIPVLGHLGEPKNCWLPLEEMTTNNDRNYFSRNPQYHMYQHPDFPSYEEQIAARDRVLEKNPDLIFVGAHLGSLEWDVDELAKRFDRFPNFAVDMAARMGQLFYQTHFDREKVRQFFIKYQDRLLYATDMGAGESDAKEGLAKELHETWYRDWRYLVTGDTLESNLVNEKFQGLKLPKEVVDKILYQNSVKWMGAFEDGAKPVALGQDSH